MSSWKRQRTTTGTIVLALALAVCVNVSARTAGTDAVTTAPLKVDRLDPAAADRIIPKDAKLERVATGFT